MCVCICMYLLPPHHPFRSKNAAVYLLQVCPMQTACIGKLKVEYKCQKVADPV